MRRGNLRGDGGDSRSTSWQSWVATAVMTTSMVVSCSGVSDGSGVQSHEQSVRRTAPARGRLTALGSSGVRRTFGLDARILDEGDARAKARAVVQAWAAARRLPDGALPELSAPTIMGSRGRRLVRFEQSVAGVPLWGVRTSVLLSDGRSEVTATGLPEARPVVGDFLLTSRDALDRAWSRHRPGAVPLEAAGIGLDGLERFGLPAGSSGPGQVELLGPARVAQVYFPSAVGLIPAYAVALGSQVRGGDRRGEEVVVSAVDGSILAARGALAQAHSYRVWTADADGTPGESPLGSIMPYPALEPVGVTPGPVESKLVEVEGLNHNPEGQADPWLAPGATTTQGNNVEAYVDFSDPNGLSGSEFHAEVTSSGVFDYAYNLSQEPLASTTQSSAAIVQAFYGANWLHDWYYDSGFDEAAGNAQVQNYGRGGLEGDVLTLEIQDAAQSADPQRNNANMYTPPDGMTPVMQIFVWSPASSSALEATPGGLLPSRPAAFGPSTFTVSGPLVAVNDGTADAMDGCQTITQNLTGQIALARRGGCSFVQKAEALSAAGAIGIVIADNVEGTPPIMDGASTVAGPTLSTTMAAGDDLIQALGEGTVTVALARTPAVERDGALDGTLVAHEWGHYMQDRLAPCRWDDPQVAPQSQCFAMGEGGGDFIALHMLLADGDDPALAYPMAGYAAAALTPDLYFGLRRVPYSTSLDINPLTLRHIEDGEILPIGVPSFESPVPNSEVHNAGEVWTTMLFEVYAALIAESERPEDPRTFADVRRDMSDDLVVALSMMPSERTFLDARDFLLTAIAARSETDAVAAATAFAKRGAGSCAVAPSWNSLNNAGVVEDFEVAPQLRIGAVMAADAQCENGEDGILDAGESGALTVEIENLGYGVAEGTVVTLSDLPEELSMLEGAEVTLAEVPGLGSATAEFPLELGALTGIVDGTVTVTLSEVPGCEPVVPATRSFALNYDVVPDGSAADDFSTEESGWSVIGEDAESVWSHSGSGTEATWHGLDRDSVSSTALVSPPLDVGEIEPLTITLSHRYSFEETEGEYWDGAVIEISLDDGATWTDAAEFSGADVGYTGTLNPTSNNPLTAASVSARAAFVGQSAGYPEFQSQVIDLGSGLAGETIRVAFRIGTDQLQGAPGWELDAVSFTGLEGGPFAGRAIDSTPADPCPEPPATGGASSGGSDGTSSGGGPGAGGTAQGSGGDGTTGGSGGQGGTDESGGCGCRVAGTRTHGGAGVALASLLTLASLVRRRRHRPQPVASN